MRKDGAQNEAARDVRYGTEDRKMSHNNPDPGAAAPRDRRVRRTRAALREALLDLVVERGYQAVTVQDVIDRADVGRSTFYAHYRDKDDLLDEGLRELRSMLLASAQTAPAARPLRFGPAFLAHLGEMRPLVRAVFLHEGNERIRSAVEATLAELVTAELAAAAPARRGTASSPGPAHPVAGRPGPRVDAGHTQAAEATTTARVRFVVGAYLAIIAWWLADQPQLHPADVDAVACALIGPGLDASASWT